MDSNSFMRNYDILIKGGAIYAKKLIVTIDGAVYEGLREIIVPI